MWIPRVLLMLMLAMVVTAAAICAQDPEAEYVTESRLLENELDRYIEARERERQSVSQLRAVARQLDDILADPNASVSEMRSLETQLTAARQSALRRLEDSSEARQRMYDRMDRLFSLASDLEQRPPDPVDKPEEGADGLWQFQFKGAGISALVDLDFNPSGLARSFVVNGTYRTSNGHTGTIRGNFSGTQVELEAVDSRRGKVAVLDGTVGADGRLQGSWQVVDTGLSRTDGPKGGLWSGHRIASEYEAGVD